MVKISEVIKGMSLEPGNLSYCSDGHTKGKIKLSPEDTEKTAIEVVSLLLEKSPDSVEKAKAVAVSYFQSEEILKKITRWLDYKNKNIPNLFDSNEVEMGEKVLVSSLEFFPKSFSLLELLINNGAKPDNLGFREYEDTNRLLPYAASHTRIGVIDKIIEKYGVHEEDLGYIFSTACASYRGPDKLLPLQQCARKILKKLFNGEVLKSDKTPVDYQTYVASELKTLMHIDDVQITEMLYKTGFKEQMLKVVVESLKKHKGELPYRVLKVFMDNEEALLTKFLKNCEKEGFLTKMVKGALKSDATEISKIVELMKPAIDKGFLSEQADFNESLRGHTVEKIIEPMTCEDLSKWGGETIAMGDIE